MADVLAAAAGRATMPDDSWGCITGMIFILAWLSACRVQWVRLARAAPSASAAPALTIDAVHATSQPHRCPGFPHAPGISLSAGQTREPPRPVMTWPREPGGARIGLWKAGWPR